VPAWYATVRLAKRTRPLNCATLSTDCNPDLLNWRLADRLRLPSGIFTPILVFLRRFNCSSVATTPRSPIRSRGSKFRGCESLNASKGWGWVWQCLTYILPSDSKVWGDEALAIGQFYAIPQDTAVNTLGLRYVTWTQRPTNRPIYMITDPT